MALPLRQLLDALVDLSKETGQWMLQQQVNPEQIETKTLNNFVSFVDKGAEERFVTGLQKLLPEAGFIAEEGTGTPSESGLNWIIDPLDGTTNFLHQFPVWCTSVALIDKDELQLGVIYDPNRNECYTAIKGEGAFLNGEPIVVTKKTALKDCLLATGFPYDDFGRQAEYLGLLGVLTQGTRGIRRLGSAALDLAYVACGRCDLFYEYSLNPWDVAAGALIVKEAGGTVTGFKEGDDPIFGDDILASNTSTHEEMLGVIERHFS
ncbi:inositol monophosphatase family protein [Sanyastnella coralliicola]|uniref:inositol monophosphatase family protein n=1 Tax=Sanyastnella coralliicola TaxID=3069118 RepID=UPI0027BA25B8|nr:inositol monophosphatase family protein [Longitalea sp. SCSIO 12813]